MDSKIRQYTIEAEGKHVLYTPRIPQALNRAGDRLLLKNPVKLILQQVTTGLLESSDRNTFPYGLLMAVRRVFAMPDDRSG